MNVVIAGGSGFIGEALARHLTEEGHAIAILTRKPTSVRLGRALRWDGRSQGDWSAPAASADLLINLAGENIGEGRWTATRKRELLQSRVDATRALVEAMRSAPGRKRTFISASAVGFYGPYGGDAIFDETALKGEGFLSDMSAQWEEEARAAEGLARLVILRFGVVIGAGGALAKMLLPFKLGLGGRIGSGSQWLSWISREDLVRLISWVAADEDVRGVVNATSPNPVRNADFTRALGRALHRPALVPIPAIGLRLLYGQMAQETLIGGQRVVPARALERHFRFHDDTVESALQRTLHAVEPS